MRRFILSLFAVIATVCAFAQTSGTMIVKQTDGTSLEVKVENIEKVYFKEDAPTPPTPTMEYVDLGLPSGIKWATCNLGASKPEEYGDYYGWGCTERYKESDYVSWETYFKYIGGKGTMEYDCGTSFDPLKDYVYPNCNSIAGTEWDAAHAALGGAWRMPTEAEIRELMNSNICTWTRASMNGVGGYVVKSKINGNYIFLPIVNCREGDSFGGEYEVKGCWTATPENSNNHSGWAVLLGLDWDSFMAAMSYRYHGRTIRPVYEEASPIPVPEAVDLGLPSGLKWANCNLGASKPEYVGNFYGWGCTKPYPDRNTPSWETYFKYIGGKGTTKYDCGTSLDPLKDYVYPNKKSIAGTEWDAAHVALGGKWRMPTADDFRELADNSTQTITSINGIEGCVVKSKINGNYIFLPCVIYDPPQGDYWGATPSGGEACDALRLYFSSRVFNYSSVCYRHAGLNIRPVTK